MKILSAEGEHFKSFQDKFVAPLDDLGLVKVIGVNEVSEAADSNGSGKTSLVVDFPSWVLFGSTPSGARGSDVACRFTEETCRGRMLMEDDEGMWAVIRTARPSSLLVEGPAWDGEDQKALQARIESRLGRGHKTFKNANIFGQGTFERFSQADQAEQMRMLDEIQGVDFRRALERAEHWRKDLKTKLDMLEQSIRTDEEGMGRLTSSVSQLEQAQAKFESTRKAAIREQEAVRARAIRERDQMLARLEELMGHREYLADLRDLRERIELQVALVHAAARDSENAVSAAEKEKRICEGKRKQVADLILAGKCPTCRADFDRTNQIAIKKAYDPDIKEAEQQVRTAGLKADDAQQAHKTADLKLKQLKAKWPQDIEDSAQALVALEGTHGPIAVQQAQQEYQRLGGEVERCDNQIKVEQKRRWDSQQVLGTSRAELADITKRLGESRVVLERSKRALKVALYWTQAFGDRGIRSLLVDSVAGYLNERLAHHLGILAAGEVAVEVSATTALKSGKQKEDLAIVSAWAWGAAGPGGSAGQDRRVDLALFAALQDLAESRSARPFPYKVWDEPGDALDTLGKEIFCRWVEHEARKAGTGFLVTHSADLSAQLQPDWIWTVILGADGAHLEILRA